MRQLNQAVKIPNKAPAGHTIVVIGSYVYGCGATLEQAVKSMKRANSGKPYDYEAHVCPLPSKDEEVVNGMGQYYSCPRTSGCVHCV